MLNVQSIAELKLDKKHTVKFLWLKTENALCVQVLRPEWVPREGHGWAPVAHALLAGEDLEAFVSAIASLQGGPEPRLAA